MRKTLYFVKYSAKYHVFPATFHVISRTVLEYFGGFSCTHLTVDTITKLYVT